MKAIRQQLKEVLAEQSVLVQPRFYAHAVADFSSSEVGSRARQEPMELADAIRTPKFVTQKEVTDAVAVRLDSLEEGLCV